MAEPVSVSVSELVGLINQTLDYAYPSIEVTGELANLRVSKGKWVYFDLKDDGASVKFFGTVFMLPGPLEDGMLLKVRAAPRLHNLYGFSMNAQSITPAGEGSLKKAAQLLAAKLEKEGLFAPERKRPLPYPPERIGLITSMQSAAYADFVKVLQARWGGILIDVIDVQVQGEPAPRQIAAAIESFNAQAVLPDVLILIRGGGSADDLAAFSTEQVTRAVAASRAPTLVAIGHEIDLSLAELAADVRASTPSNAAELLVPDRAAALHALRRLGAQASESLRQLTAQERTKLGQAQADLWQALELILERAQKQLQLQTSLLKAVNPSAVLGRGYAIIRVNGQPIVSVAQLQKGLDASVQLQDGSANVTVNEVQ